MKSGVYKIINKVSGRCYIGSSDHVRNRLLKHKSLLRLGKHHSKKLQNSWSLHGEGAFSFDALIYCSVDDLLMYEQIAIDAFDAAGKCGFNVLPIAGGTRGYKHSAEARANMSKAQTGRVVSDEARRRMSLAHKGVKQTQENIEKRKAGQIGKMYWGDNEARRQQVIERNKTRVITPEVREKMRLAKLGKKRNPHSDETRAKISLANKLRHAAKSLAIGATK